MKFDLFAMFYGSPDQWMPLPTLLSTICVFIIIFWNKVRVAFSRVWNACRPKDLPTAQKLPAADQTKSDESTPR